LLGAEENKHFGDRLKRPLCLSHFSFLFLPKPALIISKPTGRLRFVSQSLNYFWFHIFFLKNKIKYDIDRNKYRNSIMECKQKQKSIVSSFFNFCVHFIRYHFYCHFILKYNKNSETSPSRRDFCSSVNGKEYDAAGVQEDQDAVCRDVMLFIWSVLRGDVIRIDCQGGFVASSYVS